jgi:ketosteroid isomerase-like protein
MKLAVTCVLAIGTMWAQPANDKAVRTALDQFAKAVVARDQGTLTRLMEDSVAYSHSTGVVDTKASFIANVMAQKPTYEAFTYGPLAIRFNGKTAMVRGKITVKDILDGQHRTIELSVLQVWVHNQVGWQIIERQGTRLNP